MTKILWKDPPPYKRGPHSTVWWDLMEPLTKQPGRWAIVRVYEVANSAYSAAAALRKGNRHVPPGRWEITTRLNGNGGGADIYARYLGPEE